MPTSERSLTPKEQSRLSSYARIGLQMIGEFEDTRPSAVVAAIDGCVDMLQRKQRGWLARLLNLKSNNTETARALGVTWGDQVVREFGWEWVVVLLDGKRFFAVTPPDRSLAIYPTEFILECLDAPQADCTVSLSFDMLRSGSIPMQTPLSYTSVMPAIHRLKPKHALNLKRVPGPALFGVEDRDGRLCADLVFVKA
ncbi:DUF3806 domain-containing protein [Variovorax sp. J22R133]|uniref:DUF3806 domain-containing protein n=1 Tax=Variovorax brevis TaxID=3053503 RepID=UPI002576A0EF|nr:DUF3806 domain-containing protein [Variovorax sp. J22R133]MDM0113113.1 DUF3806 domain-containing protein [Variovorax sp. J22R133]